MLVLVLLLLLLLLLLLVPGYIRDLSKTSIRAHWSRYLESIRFV